MGIALGDDRTLLHDHHGGGQTVLHIEGEERTEPLCGDPNGNIGHDLRLDLHEALQQYDVENLLCDVCLHYAEKEEE